jgi:predicted CoA-binding protein
MTTPHDLLPSGDANDHLQEREYEVNPATPEYHSLMEAVDGKLAPHREITYVPFAPEQRLADPEHFEYGDRQDLPELMADVDVVVCISRDEMLTTGYTDPDRNIDLTPSAYANVDTSVEVFKLAREANPDVQFISTGRMHNRAIPMMLALPAVAEFAGINAEDAYHIREEEFEKHLRAAFTPEEYAARMHELESTEEGESTKANLLSAMQTAVGKDVLVPSGDGTEAELTALADAFLEAYKKYPRISTSRLMLEKAVKEGVPLEAMWEEDGAVDTITNLVNVAHMLESIEGLANTKKIAVVAGSDHLPRTAWITDHILPDGIEVVFVESDASLSEEAYAASCAREEQSFQKGSNWIGGTRELDEIEAITQAGYFERFSPEKLAAEVASVALKNTGN